MCVDWPSSCLFTLKAALSWPERGWVIVNSITLAKGISKWMEMRDTSSCLNTCLLESMLMPLSGADFYGRKMMKMMMMMNYVLLLSVK